MSESRKIDRSTALARLCQNTVLTHDEERGLFCRLNAVRTKTIGRRSRASRSASPQRDAAKTVLCSEAAEIRNQIVEANLRLVVSLAKRFTAPDRPLEDLVSEAAVPLIRCVESFDAKRGTRFSTYATRALTNFFAKLRRQDGRRRSRLSQGVRRNPTAARGVLTAWDALIHEEDLRRLGNRLHTLPDRERVLLAERFGLTSERRPHTFRELGIKHGLSKERVRVITGEAISRLRESLNQPPAPCGAKARGPTS